MKLSEHIKSCQGILNKHGDLDCYTSIDDEGNGYNEVHYSPSAGHIVVDGYDTSFFDEETLNDDDIMSEWCDEHEDCVDMDINVVVIN
jgi:hypothetical protein